MDNDFDSDGIVYKDMSMEQCDPLTNVPQGVGIEFEQSEDSNGNNNLLYKKILYI